MGLPQVKHPTFEEILPSTNEAILLRRFLIEEEKILLFAKQTLDPREVSRACIQIVQNCVIKGPDVETWTTFDLDWVFMKLRAQSVDNMVNVQYEDAEEEGEEAAIYKFDINLEKVEMPKPKNLNRVIEVTDQIKMKIKYPTVADMEDVHSTIARIEREQEDSDDPTSIPNPDLVSLVVAKCIDSIYDDEQVFEKDSDEELILWLDKLESKVYKGLKEFLDEMPELTYTIKFQDKHDVAREIVLRGINSFFTF